MSQLIRCRCGRWTTYGLSCTNCKSMIVSYSDEEYDVEVATDEKDIEIEVEIEEDEE